MLNRAKKTFCNLLNFFAEIQRSLPEACYERLPLQQTVTRFFCLWYFSLFYGYWNDASDGLLNVFFYFAVILKIILGKDGMVWSNGHWKYKKIVQWWSKICNYNLGKSHKHPSCEYSGPLKIYKTLTAYGLKSWKQELLCSKECKVRIAHVLDTLWIYLLFF